RPAQHFASLSRSLSRSSGLFVTPLVSMHVLAMKSWSYIAGPDELGRLPPERSRNFFTNVCMRGIGRSFQAYVVVYQPSTASPPSVTRSGVAVATPPWIAPLKPGLRASLAPRAAAP